MKRQTFLKQTAWAGTLILLLSSVCFLSLYAQETNAISDKELADMVANRTWQGIPGLERTDSGRLFFTWFTGGTGEPSPENIVILCYSDDDGKTHSSLQIMGVCLSDGTRAYDPVPWIDPKGRLWYIFNRSNRTTAEHGVYVRICDNPDAVTPVFGPEVKIDLGVPFVFRMNKLTVLSTGEWIMPVTYALQPVFAWQVQNHEVQLALHGVAISHDEGKTWKLHGAVEAPPWALESMIVELKDGHLRMLIRTNAGHLWESYSADKGVTWSKGLRSQIASPGARFFIRRLSSGNLLLVNHYNFDRNNNGRGLRTHLTAQISTDDGITWNEGLLLDARKDVSYPDGVEDKDGVIRIIYDFDRRGIQYRNDYGYIFMAKFREEDVVQRKNVSGKVVLQHVINHITVKSTDF